MQRRIETRRTAGIAAARHPSSVKAYDRVRLVVALPDLPAGAVGVVLGFCPTAEGEGVAVRFAREGSVVGRVVPAEGLEPLEPTRG
jgi:hypothetical protein